jgi:uroporphyrin-III C-methyltransferase/precorrin-2 dehydrogenase/sirohydrochlorin ferrochelatase
MRYFPLFLDLRGQDVLVVGAGAVAERKIRLLLQAGAAVHVAAAALNEAVQAWADAGRLAGLEARYDPRLLDGKRLAFAATSDSALNRAVYADAEARRVPVNVVDDSEHCRFISPAVVDRGPLQIAISTGGASPVLARRLRSRLEAALPAGLGRVAAAAQLLRDRVRHLLPAAARRPFWESVMSDANLVRWSGMRPGRIRGEMGRALVEFRRNDRAAARVGGIPACGWVYIVGAGPGHPDLLTLRALQVLGLADVILHDRLVPDAILDLARRDAERVDVGKAAGAHRCGQREIERLMVSEARKGRSVVRLKGGDPFVFGRGGEEIEALRAAGVEYEVVPGITAATACAAYAGIPLTHRDHAQALILVTGHTAAGKPEGPDARALDWARLAGPGRTVAVYMGVRQASRIRDELLAAGLGGDFPVALVVNGSRDDQQVLGGTIGRLPEMAGDVPAGAPGLLIIGQVAALGSNLCWLNERAAVAAAA